jgi:signal transduction histidine kinase
MLVLLCTGVYILRRDRSLAVEEARTRAGELLDRLSPGYGDRFINELRRAVSPPGAKLQATPQSIPNSTNQPAKAAAMQFTKEFSFQEWRDYPGYVAPVPPGWLAGLSAVQLKAWTALELAIQGTNAAAVDSASTAFQKNVADEHAQVNARWLQVQWKARHQPASTSEADLLSLAHLSKGVRSPSGLPLSQLVLLEALKRTGVAGSDVSEELWSRAIEEVAEGDGPLLPVLLEELEHALEGKAESARVVDLREARSLARNRQVLLQNLRETVLKDFVRIGRTNLWTDWQGAPALILVSPAALVRTNQPVIRIECYPKTSVSRAAAAALKQSSIDLPEYLALGVEINGVPVPAGASASLTGKPLVTRASEPEGLSDSLTLKLKMHLKDESRLLEVLDQRQHLFGGLLIIAFLTACGGLLAARRTFVQQQRLGQLKDNFVSSVSHELRAPIASIRLMAESLETERVKEPERQREYFRLMSQECRRLSGMISNVLDFSRIQQGRKEYHFEPVDIVALLRDTCLLMQPNAAERKVRLDLRVPDNSEETLVLDGQAVQQALINLVENAIKHSPAGEVVTIGLDASTTPHPHAVGVRMWVEDHGPGIPAGEHERIFERFYRLGSELRRETPGVGIGLSIVKHIAEAHGGKVTVQSAPGQGSRFTLELPGQPPADSSKS